MAFYKLNADRKTITIDTKKIPNEAEKFAVEMYVKAGYTIRYKSEKRAAAAKKRITENGGKIVKKEVKKDEETK